MKKNLMLKILKREKNHREGVPLYMIDDTVGIPFKCLIVI